jgi:hypothetical protein
MMRDMLNEISAWMLVELATLLSVGAVVFVVAGHATGKF